MGEELKKPEEKKPEEEEKKDAHEAPKAAAEEVIKKEDKNKSEDSKAAAPAEEQTPPPPQEIVLKVFMHCEGCARKVRRCLKGFPGVEEVITECKTSKVIVKGEKAEVLKVLERVQRKSHRQVQLISPIPPPPPPPEKKDEVIKADDDIIKQQEEEIPVITVVLGVYMHCEACAQEIKRRILRMKGVESAEPDLKCSQVTVKGKIEPEKLTDYIHKRTGKHAVIIKTEPEKKEDEKEKAKDEEKEKGEKEAKKDEEIAKEKKEGGDVAASGGGAAVEPPPKPEEEAVEEPKMELELKRNEFYYYYPQNHQVYYPQRFVQENYAYAYAPQMFSDENPNACTVM